MKLIIDIPEERFNWIKELKGVTDYRTTQSLYESVKNGIPLEDIKAEIENLMPTISFDVFGNKFPVYDQKEVLQILDKHIKENKQ